MADQAVIERLPAWDGYVPEWISADGEFWLSRGRDIFRADTLGARPRFVATIPVRGIQRLIGTTGLGRRLIRGVIYNLVPRSNGDLLVAFAHRIGLLRDGRWIDLEGLERPLRVLRGGCATTADGALYWGEYRGNRKRREGPLVYRLPPGSHRAEIVHRFAPGEVRHIHSIRRDPFAGDLWLCAGDWPAECRIIRSGDGFRSMKQVGGGDESWRAIHPQFRSTHFDYATDAEFATNHIWRCDAATGERQRLTEVDGPSYYGATLGGMVAFATTAELCPSQSFRGSELWTVAGDGACCRIARFRKDLFGNRILMHLFQAGLILFPSGAAADPMPFTGQGLRGLDGRMMVLRSA